MNQPTYRIRDWDKHFENSRSRAVEALRWVSIPNRHDGEGYALLMEQDDAAELFAAWVLIIQVASKCQARGTLTRDDGTPLTARSLAMKTRAPEAWFSKALKFFTERNQWLEIIETDTHPSPECHPPISQPTPTYKASAEGEKGENGREGVDTREAREVFPESESEALAKQGKSLESLSARLALPVESFIAHGASLGLGEAKVRQWADSRVANNWSTAKNKPLTPVTWPADMNGFAAASQEISSKSNHGKDNRPASRNDNTANAGRSAAFAGIGRLRPGVSDKPSS